MNPFDFPPVAAALDGLYHLVLQLGVLFSPWAGASASAAAIVALTLAVRLVLLPVAVSQVRAEVARRRLAPQVAAIRKRYAKDAPTATRKLQELYTAEHVSPLAGILPTLLQVPVLSGVYALFAHATIAGHANLLLTQTLAGAVLGANLFASLTPVVVAVAVPLVVLAALAVVVEITRRANLRWAGSAASTEAAAVPGMGAVLRILPFVTVVFAAFAPLAAALYLFTSAAWTVVERELLRRHLTPASARGAVAA
ncbi:YidC/Oxa1 family membrane protein insertase [Frondihabitans cladoniiphilus]|uniref:Membrane protein insertase YidC n=1 Tax=Frondihabitans cladoniiphilus TaxID=715785 RepID=A0ABP8VU03_9MICO